MMKIELLSPAKNLECAVAAINHGADAVYMGGPAFGARAAAGNSFEDIEQAIRNAHLYGAKVFVTLNTILNDSELEQSRAQILRYYAMGVDALIVQDLGILQLDLPPIALHASTQMDNRTPEKVNFLYQLGFERVVLARELSLTEIDAIHQQCPVELEAFVHGALCVSYSGRCYMSYAGCGRSANRGECAQFCRLPYDLYDAENKLLVKSKHLLSLKDMDRSDSLLPMMQAGVCSFKIEGRLKDVPYVKNITAYYRKKIDAILAKHSEYQSSSYGKTEIFFDPNPEKTFHRGKTEYLLHGSKDEIAQIQTPKSIGEFVGVVSAIHSNSFELDLTVAIHNGDGFCFMDNAGAFRGFRVNRVEGKRLFWSEPVDIHIGCKLYRNFDIEFDRILKGKTAVRKVAVDISLSDTPEGVQISCIAENGKQVSLDFATEKNVAVKPEQALQNLKENLSKWGDTCYEVRNIQMKTEQIYFFPNSKVAEWRRKLQELMMQVEQHKDSAVIQTKLFTNNADLFKSKPEPINIFNEKAKSLYESCGIVNPPYAFEKVQDKKQKLMQCRHCIKHTLGWCPKQHQKLPEFKEPLYLQYDNSRYLLSFDCKNCEMSLTSN